MTVNLLQQPFTDCGNADRLVALHAENLKYVVSRGWLCWARTHWQTDDVGAPVESAKHTAKMTYLQADSLMGDDNEDFREAATKHARAMESSAANANMLRLAQSDPAVARRTSQLDSDPYLLNCADGIVDLKTGMLYDHDRASLITCCAPAGLKRGFGGRWQQFLDEILPDVELQMYVQRAVGCSIVGNQLDHVLFIAYGSGANGKGTFFRALSAALGEYVTALPPHLLIEVPQQAHPTEIADLFGKRLAVSSEIPKNKKLDECKLKAMSGGDRIKARFLNKDFFEWWPTHTLWVCGNDRPRITGTDKGIWRRVRLIPFTMDLTGEAVDAHLDEKLAAERDEILQWCVDGARDYLTQGLGTCDAVSTATAEYRRTEDVFGGMLEALCDFDPEAQTSKKEFRELLKIMYEDAGMHHQPSDKMIKNEFDSRNIGTGRNNPVANRTWIGISIKPLVATQLRSSANETLQKKARSWNEARDEF